MTLASEASGRETNDVSRMIAVYERFAPRGRRHLVAISGMSFLSGLIEAAVLVSVTAVGLSVTRAEGNVTMAGVTVTTVQALGVAVGMLCLNAVLSLILSRQIANTATRASLAAHQALLSSFHRSSYERKSQDRVAALQEALTTYVDRFAAGFSSLINVFSAGLNLTSFAIAALVINPLAAIALAFLGVLLLVVLRPATRRTRAAGKSLAHQRREYAEGATESVLLSRELAVFGVSDVAGDHLEELDQAVGAEYWRVRYMTSLAPKLYQGLAMVMAVIGLYGLSRVEVASLAALGAVVILLIRSLSYGQQVLVGIHQISEHRAYVDRMVDMLDAYQSEPRDLGSIKVGPFRELEMASLGFTYRDGAEALHGVNLSIEAGETIGVVGPSGAGKTTLVNLLLRLYRPTSGSLLVNGVDLHDVLEAEWTRSTAIVPQDPRLIHGTIAENIRFLRQIDDAAVRQAAQDANIAEYIESLPLGYESPVNELGTSLSGGQRQRICIARALAGNPDLLVLDEPTSALDGESEEAIQRTLQNLTGRVTMLIVAHRMSTLTICDRLVLLSGGTVLDAGTADELRESSEYYRDAIRRAGLQ